MAQGMNAATEEAIRARLTAIGSLRGAGGPGSVTDIWLDAEENQLYSLWAAIHPVTVLPKLIAGAKTLGDLRTKQPSAKL